MNMQEHILAALHEQFERWQTLLAGMGPAQIAAPHVPSDWSASDVMAHLWAWQQRSIARLEAALLNREPIFPGWQPALEPDSEDNTDRINAWLHATYREQPWPAVYQQWHAGFLRFLELGAAIAEKDLLDGSKYTWMDGRPLALVLLASYDHHQEHLELLLAWLQEHGNSYANDANQ